jgi:maleate cis-trans isomerase
MTVEIWRGVVGLVMPVRRAGILEQVMRLLPQGVGVFPIYNNIQKGTREEFTEALKEYESRIAEVAEVGVDLIHPSGAPPFMLLGYEGEGVLVRKWEQKFKVPIFTSGMNYVAAMRALKVKRFAGFSYFKGDLNNAYAAYFTNAGFEVLGMDGMDVGFHAVPDLSTRQCYQFIKSGFRQHSRDAEAIFLLGPGWPTMDIVQTLEDDCGVPVVHPSPAQCWEFQKRLRIHEPRTGYGRLLAELPDMC